MNKLKPLNEAAGAVLDEMTDMTPEMVGARATLDMLHGVNPRG